MLCKFAEFAKEGGGISPDVIKRAFKETEEDFCHMVQRSLPLKPQMATVGTCCLFGAITNGTLYVANLGDSRAVLGRVVSGVAAAERLSTDHNVAVEEVRKEVKALNPDDSQIVMYIRGVWRIKGIIQVCFLELLLPCFLACLCDMLVSMHRRCSVIVCILCFE